MPSATSTKGVSCSVAGAGKVTLIGSNCPASWVGRCIDCEGGRTTQIFSDYAITKYLRRVTAHQPCGRQTAVPYSRQTITITIAAVESLNDPGLQRNRPPGDPPTVALPDGQYPGTSSGDSVDRQNDSAPVLSAVTCLLLYMRSCMRFLHTVNHFHIVSYRNTLCDIVSCPLWLYRAITTNPSLHARICNIST